MLPPKTAILQVRVDPELLERFRIAAEEGYRQTPSAAVRDMMLQACDQYDKRVAYKAEQQAKLKR